MQGLELHICTMCKCLHKTRAKAMQRAIYTFKIAQVWRKACNTYHHGHGHGHGVFITHLLYHDYDRDCDRDEFFCTHVFMFGCKSLITLAQATYSHVHNTYRDDGLILMTHDTKKER